MKRIFTLTVILALFFTIADAQNFSGVRNKLTPSDSSCLLIKTFINELKPNNKYFDSLLVKTNCGETNLVEFITSVKRKNYAIGYTVEKAKDSNSGKELPSTFYLIFNSGYGKNISFYENQIKNLREVDLSRWMFYQLVSISNPIDFLKSQTLSLNSDEKIIENKKLAEVFAKEFSIFLVEKKEIKNLSHIDFEIDCVNKLIPSKDFNNLIAKDASFLMAGESGKLKQSKISFNLFTPEIQSFEQIPKWSNDFQTVQLGIALQSDGPLDLTNNKLNFKGIITGQYDKIIKKSSYKFENKKCIDCMVKSYNDKKLTKENVFDSLYSKLEWNTKKLYWFSLKGSGNFKSYNLYNEAKKDSVFNGVNGGFLLEGSWNFHHYVNQKYSGKENTYGNKYLKIGLIASLANDIETENLRSIEIENYEKSTNSNDSSKVLKSRLNAFDQDDFKNQKFTLAPSIDYYMMNKKRSLGLHISSKYYFEPFSKSYSDNQSLISSFGVFTSITKNDYTDRIHKDKSPLFNVELLFTSVNLLSKKYPYGNTFGGIFTPELKFEIPFKLLEN